MSLGMALLVTAQNFSGTNTLSFVLIGAIRLLLILLPTARRLGARSQASAGGSACGVESKNETPLTPNQV
jgi:hypothetical protein